MNKVEIMLCRYVLKSVEVLSIGKDYPICCELEDVASLTTSV